MQGTKRRTLGYEKVRVHNVWHPLLYVFTAFSLVRRESAFYTRLGPTRYHSVILTNVLYT